MCGIAGHVGAFLPGLAARMNAAQRHRGPDGAGVFEDASAEVALAHTRLAILDLSPAGAQPMTSADGRFVLVYNGEIYNFRALRAELEARGRRFPSTGDSIVLLEGLAEHGVALLPRLNGMFAFALWDRRERELLLARDPLGVKPLYLARPAPGTLLFASEIKALFAHPGVPREPDFVALQQHLTYGYAAGDGTAFRTVRRLPPGHWLRWRAHTGAIEQQPYWEPRPHAPEDTDRARAVAGLRRRLEDAVDRQLVSDVPVGVFLSGGLDSSLVTRFAAARPGGALRAYTVVPRAGDAIMDATAEDAPHARRLARALGLPLEEIALAPALTDLLPELIFHLDEPLADPAIISCALVCRLARDHGSTVLLSGQGADELFCGYPRYPAARGLGHLAHLPPALRRLLGRGAALLPGGRAGTLGMLARQVRRALVEVDRDEDDRFLALCGTAPEGEIAPVLSEAVCEDLATERPGDAFRRAMADCRLDGLLRLRDHDLRSYLPNHNLLYTDKLGMAASVEPRVPYLDLDVVDTVLGYPPAWLLAGRTTKAILRDAARGVVADTIIDRRKAGFGAPFRKWLRDDLAPLWEDVMSDAALRRRGWFDPRALRAARARSQAGAADLYMLQWAALTVELWARRFLDRHPLEAEARAGAA